ncbi:DUF1289 domain-containing protein [Paracoccaceae bacterium]|nr:DUF1289 domain-containing protein [Paracoccaceae bacterium]MDG1676053.1 DUF1289 domain-containing protein [Paracoccaceae bacterium]MDG2247774.1 DUF1289 domain-containing protein [Paracoccaceae bacterium]
MSSEVWTRNEIQSPCIKICVIHPSERLCTGCLRTIEEISAWSRLPTEQREKVINELPKRALRLKKRRGGRAARNSNLS